MCNPINEGVKSTETNDETRSSDVQELVDVILLAAVKVLPLCQRKWPDNLNSVTDPLIKQLDLLCHLVEDLGQPPPPQTYRRDV